MSDVAARSLNLISLCTGGGGLDLGVELAIPSARPVCLVEREAFGAGHLVQAMRQGLMADAPIWSDARTFRGREWRGCVDGVIGGIPCQPHSHAGRRLGAADERDLWSSARRIIVQSGAWWVLIENVPGMLSAKPGETPGAERVWRDLQRLGFQVEGGLFEAPEVGATDERQRIFILGISDARYLARGVDLVDPASERWGEGRPQSVVWGGRNASAGDGGQLADAGSAGLQVAEQPGQPGPAKFGLCQRSTASELRGAHVVDAGGGRCDGRAQGEIGRPIGGAPVERPSGISLWPPRPDDAAGWREALSIWPEAQPAVRGMAHGVAGRVDPIRMLGNGVKPLQAAYALRTLAADLARRSAGAAELVRLMGGAA